MKFCPLLPFPTSQSLTKLDGFCGHRTICFLPTFLSPLSSYLPSLKLLPLPSPLIFFIPFSLFPSFIPPSGFLPSPLTQVALLASPLCLCLSVCLISLLSLKLMPELSRRQGPTPDSHSSSFFQRVGRRAEIARWCVFSPHRTCLALLIFVC